MSDPIEHILRELLENIGVPYKDISRNEVVGQVIYSIESPEAGHALIGYHSDAIHALDHIVKKIVEKKSVGADGVVRDREDRALFLVDVNNHRTQQIRDIEAKALMMAERARSFQYDVELSPMSAYERLIVHSALQNAPNVKTESQGEGKTRRVVIKYSIES